MSTTVAYFLQQGNIYLCCQTMRLGNGCISPLGYETYLGYETFIAEKGKGITVCD
jgi:hypothetical protein